MRRYWTEDDRALLDLMTQQGYGVPDIARKLKCDVQRIYNHTKGGKIVTLRAQKGAKVRPVVEVGTLFGVSKNTAYHWVERGWLQGRRNKAWAVRAGSKPQRPHYLITEQAILDFIENRKTWVAWDVWRITDPDWRKHAECVRRDAGGYWLTSKDMANRFGYSGGTVSEWARRGVLPSLKYGQNHFFWSEDLAGWQPPLERRGAYDR